MSLAFVDHHLCQLFRCAIKVSNNQFLTDQECFQHAKRQCHCAVVFWLCLSLYRFLLYVSDVCVSLLNKLPNVGNWENVAGTSHSSVTAGMRSGKYDLGIQKTPSSIVSTRACINLGPILIGEGLRVRYT